MTTPLQAPARGRRALAAFAAVVALLVLSACGGRIDTTLTLTGDGSGERVMRVTLSSSDAEDVEGGAEAIEKSVRAHLPEQLTMSEVAETDDGFVTTMTLAFTDLADYTAKVTALLEASGKDITPEITHSVSDTAFLRGVELEENFTSADLLGWVGAGLLEDKLVEQDAADAAVENGATGAKVGDKEYESYSSYVRVDDVADRGIRDLKVTTSRSDTGFTRVVVLGLPTEVYQEDAAGLDAAMTELLPAGATVVPSDADGSHVWTVTFSGDAAAIAAGTDTLLGTSGSVWSWTESQGATGQQVEIVDKLVCGTTCSPDLYRPEVLHVVPEAWVSGDVFAEDVVDGQAYVRSDPEGTPSVYEIPLVVTRVDASLDLDRTGAGEARIVFSLPTAAAGDGAAIEAALRPADGVGTLGRTDDGTTTRVTVTIAGATADELEDRLDSYAGISYSARDEGSFFSMDLGLRVSMDLSERLTSPPVEGTHVAVNLPFGAKAAVSSGFFGTTTAKADGRTVTWVDADGYATSTSVDVTGTTVAGLVRNVVVGLIALALVGLAVWKRRAIAHWWRATQAASRERTAALAAASASTGGAGVVSASAGVAGGAPADSAVLGGGTVPGSADAPGAPAVFTEAQLR